jgi:dipeptidyl aminopeptidase/acylaminoacyl peptidase
LINKDGSGLQLIYQTPDGSFITECDWSYDESVIALKTNDIDGYNTSIYTIDINGNLLDTILTGVTGAAGGLNISIDNQKLLYTYDTSGYEDASYRQLDTHIFIYNFTTTNTFDLSFDKTAGTNDLDPRFTPNEARVIFVNTSNDGISEKQIFLVDLDGENREMLFENAFMPDWE